MSKASYISRYMMILRKVKKHPYCTLVDIQGYIQHQHEYLLEVNEQLKIGKSDRTIQRDIKEIRRIWNVQIEYCPRSREYFIANEYDDNFDFMEMLDNFEIMHTIHQNRDTLPNVFLDKRYAAGFDNFNFINSAIKETKIIHFTYKKYWDDSPLLKTIKPIALKEYKYRWYLIGQDTNNEDKIRTYGLDRIYDISMTNKSFKIPSNIVVPDLFKHCFGIIYNEGDPEIVEFSANLFQSKYIKSLPLHNSQETISEDEKQCIFRLKIHITFDIEQEFLSLGSNIKVLKPASLVQRIKNELKKTLANYEN